VGEEIRREISLQINDAVCIATHDKLSDALYDKIENGIYIAILDEVSRKSERVKQEI